MASTHFRATWEISLLKEKSMHSIRVLNSDLSNFITNNEEYRKRCLSQIEHGKTDFNKMLEDARKVIFNKEDLINWLYKMKLDAQGETDLIFIEHKANLMEEEEKIAFERAGFLAGVYEEAEKYLNLIVASEPTDKNKPHYSILDRLDQLDQEFIRNNNIPGYYYVQEDKRILKQEYQLRNLDERWRSYLSIKDTHQVTEGFGDIQYLLRDYHSEFRWELARIKPRESVKEFLNFHFNHFSNEKSDFLNHIEFRILPDLDNFSGSDYPVFQIIINEWLREKRSWLDRADEVYLIESMAAVSASFLDGIALYKPFQDENKFNTAIVQLLNQRFHSKSWTAKDQTLGGSSNSESTRNRAGLAFRDLIIVDSKNNHLSAIECFRLKSVPANNERDSEISNHLKKIFQNETQGISPLFILVYCETKSFQATWNKYLTYISRINFEDYLQLDIESPMRVLPERANIKIAKARHIREASEINVYHIFINMFP